MRTFFVGAMDGPGQCHRVPHIPVVNGDIEVTHEHQFVMAREFIFQPLLQRGQPSHFVNKLVAVRRLAIGEIRTDHAHTVDRAGDDTRHVIGKTGNVVHHVSDRVTRNQRHTVIGFLTEKRQVVSGGFNLCPRKFVVRGFGFLQCQYVDGLVAGVCVQPIEHLRQAHGE